MQIAYLINQYPKVSHTFVRREIAALEAQGCQVLRFALRGWDAELVDEEDREERKRTHYILKRGIVSLLAAGLTTLVSRPAAFGRALVLALRMSSQSDRPLPLHIAYLLEACAMLKHLKAARHLHAHFGTNSAEIAMFAHALGGPSWSFTAHGPEEFDKASQLHLDEKIRRSAFVVAISSYGRSQLFRQVGHEHWDKIKLVYCGLDRAFLDTAGAPSSSRRLVCVGRLTEQKGQLLLIEAAARLKDRGIDFELVLAGDGEMRREVEARIDQLGLGGIVRITGWISVDRVKTEILQSRALVLPSFAEGLPIVLMEALSLGRPVITTYVAGIPELVEPGRHGWLVPAGDVDALADAMRQALAASSPELAAMGDAGAKVVRERHSVDKNASTLIELFSRYSRD